LTAACRENDQVGVKTRKGAGAWSTSIYPPTRRRSTRTDAPALGTVVLAGTRTAWSWTRVEAVEDGWLHLRLLTEEIR
jgi:hypothetical protein